MEESMSGTAGRRKRGSWCGTNESRTVAESAERIGRVSLRVYQSRKRAGPRSCGREAMKC